MEESSSLFNAKQEFPQCIGVIDCTHVSIKQPLENSTNYINRKGHYTLNIQAVADLRYCFTDVLIKWPGSVHDAQIFSNSSLNQQFRDGAIPSFEKVIVQNEPPVPICLLRDPAYPQFPFLMKEFMNGGKTKVKHSLDFVYPQLGWLLSVCFEDLKLISVVSGEKWTLT